MKKDLTESELQDILSSQKVRSELAYRSHYWCFHTYFAHYVKCKTAPFQKELFRITEDEETKMAAIVSFRGSAKSTIMGLSYPIWAILGVQQKKFILIATQTQQQAKLMISNIRQELELNKLLKADLGPFKEESNEWGSSTLFIPKFGARIAAVSTEQSIRGVRNMENRPDLIIVDDAEDINSTKTKEGRDKTFSWLVGDLIPTGDLDTKVIVIGNLLHEDSLLMRLEEKINEGQLDGVFLRYPLLDKDGQSIWPGKYPNKETIERRRLRFGDDYAWQREFLLKIIPPQNQVIHRDWIRYYDDLPKEGDGVELCYIATGVDLAISEKSEADQTAFVSGKIYSFNGRPYLYILPNPFHDSIDSQKTYAKIKELALALGNGVSTKVLVESVAYQTSLGERLRLDNIDAVDVKVGSVDKRSRLAINGNNIFEGYILFPRYGCEELISNIVNFRTEKHEDLSDAFSLLANYCFANYQPPLHPSIDFIGGSPDYPFDDDDDDDGLYYP